MPEGPEIRRAADTVSAALKGHKTQQVHFGLDRLKPYQGALTGVRVERIDTHGKAMLTRFENGLTIYSHNQLYGRWFTGDADWTPDTNRSLRLAIRNNYASALLYSASDIEVVNAQGLAEHPFLVKLGPDVLATTTSSDIVFNRLNNPRFTKRRLGNLLTDQSFVAGLGNYLRCEILFVCGLHPSIPLKQCRDIQIDKLAQAILALPRQSYETGGITNDLSFATELQSHGNSFEASRFHLFRREGKPCYRCGTTIEKTTTGGQACYICPQCQPLR